MAEKLNTNPGQMYYGQTENGWGSIEEEVLSTKNETMDKISEKLQGAVNKAKELLEKVGSLIPDKMRLNRIAEMNRAAMIQDPWSETTELSSIDQHYRTYNTLFNKVREHERPNNEEIADVISEGLYFGSQSYDGKYKDYQREALGTTVNDLLDIVGDYDDFDVLSRPANLYDEHGQIRGRTSFKFLFGGKNENGEKRYKYLNVFRTGDGSGPLIAALCEANYDARTENGPGRPLKTICRQMVQDDSGIDVLSFEIGDGASKEVGTQHFDDPQASDRPVMPQLSL